MAKKSKAVLPPEWSYPFRVEDLPQGGVHKEITAGPEACAALAQRLGVESVDSLSVSYDIGRDSGSAAVHVQGQLHAHLTQHCVVSGAPIVSEVQDRFEGWFADPAQVVTFTRAKHQQQIKKGNLEIPMLEEREDPEPIVDGVIDLGELATQYLSLAINPYPHAPGVHYEQGDEQASAPAKDLMKNPFAALKAWKDRVLKDD